MATVSLASPPDVSIRVSHSSPSRSSTAGRSFTYPPIAATSATSAMYSMARNIYGCGTRLSRSVCLSDARSGSPWPLSQGCSAGRVTLPAGAMHIHPRDTVTANPYPSGLGFPTLGSPAGAQCPSVAGATFVDSASSRSLVQYPARPFPNLRRRVAQAKRTGATVLQHHQEPGGCSTTGAGRARHTGEHRKGSNACLWAERVHPRADFGSRSGSWRLACFLTRSSRAHVWPSRRCRRRCIRAQRPVSLWCLIPRSSDVAAVAPCAARRDVAFRLVVSRRHSQPFAITSSAVCSTTLPAANRRRGGKRVTWCLLDRRLRC